eukprot:Lankesteria_metandrocarpae@DN7637_c0_g1_i1.p1
MRWTVTLAVVSWICSLQIGNNYPVAAQQQESQHLEHLTPDFNTTSHLENEIIKESALVIGNNDYHKNTSAHSPTNSQDSNNRTGDTGVGSVHTNVTVNPFSLSSTVKIEFARHNDATRTNPQVPVTESFLAESTLKSAAQVARRYANNSISMNFPERANADLNGTVSPDDTVFTVCFVASMVVSLAVSSAVLSGQKRKMRRLRLYRLAEHV